MSDGLFHFASGMVSIKTHRFHLHFLSFKFLFDFFFVGLKFLNCLVGLNERWIVSFCFWIGFFGHFGFNCAGHLSFDDLNVGMKVSIRLLLFVFFLIFF